MKQFRPEGKWRLLLLRGRRLGWFGCLVAACGILFAACLPAAVPAAAASRQLPIYCVQLDQKRLSISFDAAWGNEDTQQLIDILARYRVHATFFVVGDWVEKYPESVRALADAGHEVMSHSDTHAHLPQLSADEIVADLNACNDKIEGVTGVRPTLIRPPYGDYDDHSVLAIRSMGLEPIQWDVDSLDWKGISAEEIAARVIQKAERGSIVLFHNAAEHTPEALPTILEALLQEGYEIVPVSQLLLPGDYQTDWHIDVTGRQIAGAGG